MPAKRILILTVMIASSLTLSGCFLHHGHHHVPPGQVKKHKAPGHLKKHTGIFPDKVTITVK